jgi:hypothetical protein
MRHMHNPLSTASCQNSRHAGNTAGFNRFVATVMEQRAGDMQAEILEEVVLLAFELNVWDCLSSQTCRGAM